MLERLGNFRQKFNRMVFNRVGDGPHLRGKIGRHRHGTESLIGADERMRKTVEAVSVRHNALALDVVQNFTNLLWSEFVMIQEGNEAGDGALKVDVVLPERIVGIDEESLSGQAHSLLAVSVWRSGTNVNVNSGTPERAASHAAKKPAVPASANPIDARFRPDDACLVAHVEKTADSFASVRTVVERAFVHVHPDKLVGRCGVEITRKLHRVGEGFL